MIDEKLQIVFQGIKKSIEDAESRLDEPLYEASWSDQTGLLLSYNEGRQIIDFIEQNPVNPMSWSQAPKDAKYQAIDSSGSVWWFDEIPTRSCGDTGCWNASVSYFCCVLYDMSGIDWKRSLKARPGISLLGETVAEFLSLFEVNISIEYPKTCIHCKNFRNAEIKEGPRGQYCLQNRCIVYSEFFASCKGDTSATPSCFEPKS